MLNSVSSYIVFSVMQKDEQPSSDSRCLPQNASLSQLLCHDTLAFFPPQLALSHPLEHWRK